MHRRFALPALASALTLTGLAATPAHAAPRAAVRPAANECPPAARALGYSDALDKYTSGGTTLGGLSSIAYDSRAHAYVSAVDDNKSDPARLWFYRDLGTPPATR